MKKLFDKDGNEIPKEEITILVCQALSALKRERAEKLAKDIMDFANKRVIEKQMFDMADAYMVISIIKNHDETYPLG